MYRFAVFAFSCALSALFASPAAPQPVDVFPAGAIYDGVELPDGSFGSVEFYTYHHAQVQHDAATGYLNHYLLADLTLPGDVIADGLVRMVTDPSDGSVVSREVLLHEGQVIDVHGTTDTIAIQRLVLDYRPWPSGDNNFVTVRFVVVIGGRGDTYAALVDDRGPTPVAVALGGSTNYNVTDALIVEQGGVKNLVYYAAGDADELMGEPPVDEGLYVQAIDDIGVNPLPGAFTRIFERETLSTDVTTDAEVSMVQMKQIQRSTLGAAPPPAADQQIVGQVGIGSGETCAFHGDAVTPAANWTVYCEPACADAAACGTATQSFSTYTRAWDPQACGFLAPFLWVSDIDLLPRETLGQVACDDTSANVSFLVSGTGEYVGPESLFLASLGWMNKGRAATMGQWSDGDGNHSEAVVSDPDATTANGDIPTAPLQDGKETRDGALVTWLDTFRLHVIPIAIAAIVSDVKVGDGLVTPLLSYLVLALNAPNAPPNADFDVKGITDLTVEFEDLSTDDGGVVGWAWDFGDSGTSTDQNPTHEFPAEGEYTVELVVTDAQGETSSITKQVKLPPDGTPPVASFDVPTLSYGYVLFNNTSRDDDGDIVRTDWDFGDGNTSTGHSPSHRYTSDGTYTVRLVVTDDDGLTDEYSEELTIEGSNCRFVFSDTAGNQVDAVELATFPGAPVSQDMFVTNVGAGLCLVDVADIFPDLPIGVEFVDSQVTLRLAPGATQYLGAVEYSPPKAEDSSDSRLLRAGTITADGAVSPDDLIRIPIIADAGEVDLRGSPRVPKNFRIEADSASAPIGGGRPVRVTVDNPNSRAPGREVVKMLMASTVPPLNINCTWEEEVTLGPGERRSLMFDFENVSSAATCYAGLQGFLDAAAQGAFPQNQAAVDVIVRIEGDGEPGDDTIAGEDFFATTTTLKAVLR